MNIQFAVKDGEIYVLEVNPRASRTVPFVSKATGLNLAQAAARVMVGRIAGRAGDHGEPVPRYVSVKEAVFPFAKFPGVDIVLGPEMRSTGEVMGIAMDFPAAFAKSQLGGDEPAAGRRDGFRERRAARPQRGRADRPTPGRDGLPTALHRGHRRVDGRARHRRRGRPEDPRGAARTCWITWRTARSR